MSEKDANLLKTVFSGNLKRYMDRDKMNTADLANALSLPFSTVSDWVHGRKYPRMDKVQIIADFFGIMKSDLTEESSGPHPAEQKEAPLTASDEERLNQELIARLCQLTPEELEKVDAFVQGLLAAR